MNKKLLSLLLVGLLVAGFAACNKTPDATEETSNESDTTGDYIVIGTDEQGNEITEPGTTAPDEPNVDPSETDPTFVDITKKVVIFTNSACIRTATVLADNNIVSWPAEGKVLDVTGESEKWYRIDYPVNDEIQTCYVAKTVVADADVLDAFQTIEPEEVVVNTTALYVRSYPSAESDLSIRGTLAEGAKVTRVAVSENWSRILFEVEVTDAEGNKTTETKEYYVSSKYVTAPESETTAEETTVAEETTEAPEA